MRAVGLGAPGRGRTGLLVTAHCVGLLLVVGVSPAEAQQVLGTDCDLVSYRVLQSEEMGLGQRVTHVSRPVLECPDGSRIRSDTATVYSQTGMSTFGGDVRYETTQWTLESDQARYMERERELTATGSAVLQDHRDGSVIRGDTLVHREGALDGEDLLTATGDRPTASLRPTGPAGGVDFTAEVGSEYQVEGNRLRFEGERYLRAYGTVQARRADMNAAGDSMTYARQDGLLTFGGDARLDGREYELEAETIILSLPGDRLREVRALGSGILTTADITVTAPSEIRILMEDDEVMERMVAVRRVDEAGPEGPDGEEETDPGQEREPDPTEADEPGEEEAPPPEEAEDSDLPQAEAITEDFLLRGDSIDVLAPGEILETVTAVGRAHGESRGRVLPGDLEEDFPELARKDWLEGDEIVATFERIPDVALASAPQEIEQQERRYRLDELVARGSARSLYRLEVEREEDPEEDEDEEVAPDAEPGEEEVEGEEAPEEDGPERRWGISYVLADEIRIIMEGDEVERMEAEGNVEGVHLEPGGRTPLPALDPQDGDSPGGGGEDR